MDLYYAATEQMKEEGESNHQHILKIPSKGIHFYSKVATSTCNSLRYSLNV
jgi:hypothetical protein